MFNKKIDTILTILLIVALAYSGAAYYVDISTPFGYFDYYIFPVILFTAIIVVGGIYLYNKRNK